MGLPLAAQFASHGWHVIAVDVQRGRRGGDQRRVARTWTEEPGLAERVAAGPRGGPPPGDDRRGGRGRGESDVVVLIVPVMLDDEQQPDYRYMDAAVASIAPGRPRGLDWSSSRRRCRSATRATGSRPASRRASGLRAERGLLRRLLARAALQRRGAPQPGHLPEARRRGRAGLDRPGGRASTPRSSTPRSWR